MRAPMDGAAIPHHDQLAEDLRRLVLEEEDLVGRRAGYVLRLHVGPSVGSSPR